MRYGADSKYATRLMSNAARCDALTLGFDPAPGVAKSCQVEDAGTTPPPGPTPPVPPVPPETAGWKNCASEGQTCFFEGTSSVRYGADGKYATRVMSNAARCDALIFGFDPAPGIAKSCQVQGTPTTPPSGPTARPEKAGWTTCAVEGRVCTFAGTLNVRYGANGQFVLRVMSNAANCDTPTFGRDPTPGIVKVCQVPGVPTSQM